MLNDKLKELEKLRARAAELEMQVAAERAAELKALPQRYGFDSVEAFIAAVRAASGGARKRRGRPPLMKKGDGDRRRRKRAKITAETKAEVKALVKSGKTGRAIAEALGISLPSVQNIKKELGLVQPRK